MNASLVFIGAVWKMLIWKPFVDLETLTESSVENRCLRRGFMGDKSSTDKALREQTS